MYAQVHANRVLYKRNPLPGHEYRQIVIVELDQFQVRIFEGHVIRADPDFGVDNPDAEIHLHGDLRGAMADVEKEFTDSVTNGWEPYNPAAF